MSEACGGVTVVTTTFAPRALSWILMNSTRMRLIGCGRSDLRLQICRELESDSTYSVRGKTMDLLLSSMDPIFSSSFLNMAALLRSASTNHWRVQECASLQQIIRLGQLQVEADLKINHLKKATTLWHNWFTHLRLRHVRTRRE